MGRCEAAVNIYGPAHIKLQLTWGRAAARERNCTAWRRFTTIVIEVLLSHAMIGMSIKMTREPSVPVAPVG